MATIRIVDAAGVEVRAFDVPPVDRIQLRPGERAVFDDIGTDGITITNQGDFDTVVTVDNFDVTISGFYAQLENADDVGLVFADSQIATLDDLIATAAGEQPPGDVDEDDGLGNDGTVTIGDLFPDHLRARGVIGEIPQDGFQEPEGRVAQENLGLDGGIGVEALDGPRATLGLGTDESIDLGAGFDPFTDPFPTPSVLGSTSGALISSTGNPITSIGFAGFPTIVTSGGDPIDITTRDDSGTLVIEGSAGGRPVFELSISPTGDVTFDLLDGLDHGDPSDPDDLQDLVFVLDITDSTGATGSATVTISVSDDGPALFVGDNSMVCLNEAPPIATDDVGGTIDSASATGRIVVYHGSDGPNRTAESVDNLAIVPGSGGMRIVPDGQLDWFSIDGIRYTDDSGDGSTIAGTSDGEPISHYYFLDGDTLIVVGVTGRFEPSLGPDSGNTVWRLEIDTTTGDFDFDLIRGIDHMGAGESGDDDVVGLEFGVTITDFDMDSTSASFHVCVRDGVPTIDEGGQPGGDGSKVVVTEDSVGKGNDQEFVPDSATGTLLFSYGMDGPAADGALVVEFTSVTDGDPNVQAIPSDPATLTSNGVPLTYSQGTDGSGNTIITGSAGGNTIFVITITPTPTGASYVFELLGPLDHPDVVRTGDDDVLDLNFTYTITDSDGDSHSSTFTVAVEDDAPRAKAEVIGLDEGLGNSVSGNVFDNDDPGGDNHIVVTMLSGRPVPEDGLRVDGKYGFVTIKPDGSYTYTLTVESVPPHGMEDFFYHIVDADGDTAKSVIWIHFHDTNQPVAEITHGIVEESALDSDDVVLGDDIGSDPAAITESTSGTLNFTSTDPAKVTEVNGVPVSDTGNTIIIGTHGTLTINGDGQYRYDLTDNGDHSGGPVADQFTYVVTDDDGSTASSTLRINITDDQPIAEDDSNAANEGIAKLVNLTMVVDVSGSMGDIIPGTGKSRLSAMKEALADLIDGYGDITAEVTVTFVVFASGGDLDFMGDTAGAFNTVTMNIADAGDFIDSLALGMNGLGLSTEYDDALVVTRGVVEGIVSATPSSDEVSNIVYFVSDGEPFPSNNTTPADWKTFVVTNGVRSIAVRIGPEVVPGDSPLNDVAYPDDIVVVEDGALTEGLLATIPTNEGSVVDGNVLANDVFGADGPAGGDAHVASLSFTDPSSGETLTFQYDPVTGTITNPDGTTTSGDTVTIVTPLDGVLSFNFETGGYTYAAPPVDGNQSEAFAYTIVDGDGSTASAELTLNITDLGTSSLNTPPVPESRTVWVPDNTAIRPTDPADPAALPGVLAAAGYALMVNPAADLEGDTLTYSIGDVPGAGDVFYHPTGASDGVFVALVGGEALDAAEFASLRYLPDNNGVADSGNLSYTVSDGVAGPVAASIEIKSVIEDAGSGISVAADNGTPNTIWGSALADELLGGDQGDIIFGGDDDDNIQAGEGDDTAHGGDGDDIINGGAGNDLLYGGKGNDTLYSGLDNDAGDKLYGGQGDDILVLQDLTPSADFKEIRDFAVADGGSGFDRLHVGNDFGANGIGKLYMGPEAEDNQVAKLHSIELIDMTDGDSHDRVSFDAASVNTLGASNNLAPMADDDGVLRDIDIFVAGNENDSISLWEDNPGEWSHVGTMSNPFGEGSVYRVYENGDALIAVEEDLSRDFPTY